MQGVLPMRCCRTAALDRSRTCRGGSAANGIPFWEASQHIIGRPSKILWVAQGYFSDKGALKSNASEVVVGGRFLGVVVPVSSSLLTLTYGE